MKVMIYSTFLQVLILMSAFKTADGKCGGVYTKDNGTISVQTNVTEKTDCIYTITKKEDGNTLLQLTNIDLKDSDKLTIYDGEKDEAKLVASYSAGMTVGFQVAVGFQKNTTIIFSQGGNKTKSTWSIEYNTKECEVTLHNLWALRVDSPIYLPTKDKKMSCTYSINSASEDRLSVASFLSFDFTGKSSLKLTSGDSSHNYNASDMPDDFFAKDTVTPINITIDIDDAANNQNFSLVVESVIAECSGEKMVGGNLSVSLTIPANHPVSYVCRWLLRTNLSVVIANVTSLDVISSTDVLSFIDGGSSRGSALATLMDDMQNFMVASSSEAMIVTFSLGKNPGSRSLSLDFIDKAEGGHFTKNATFSVNGPVKDSIYYQLVADVGQVVSVQITSNVSGNATVTFHNGLQATDDVIAVISSSNEDLKAVIGSEAMLMVLSDLADKEKFEATFSSVKSGCDQLATGQTGQLMYQETNVNETETCTWTIAPLNPDGTIIIYMDSVMLADKETVTVYSGLKGKEEVAQFTNKQMSPVQIYVSAMDKARVVITRGKTYQKTTNVALRYEVTKEDCGGEIAVPSTGNISTPNYPNFYPLNAQCVWHVVDKEKEKTGKSLFITFKDIKLAKGHQIQVTGVNRKIGYGGMASIPQKLPSDLIVPLDNETNIQFLSTRNTSEAVVGDINEVGGGAFLTYWTLECGGNFSTDSGSFQSPEYPKPPKKAALCVWIVDLEKVPTLKDGTNIVRFSLNASDGEKLSKSLQVYDGDSIRANQLPIPVNKTTKEVEGMLSRYNRIIFLFNYADSGSAFSLKYETYKCNSTQMCDNGVCMQPSWPCNHIDDCGDNSDERDCPWPGPHPTPKPKPTPKPSTDYSGYVKSGWVAGCLFIGIVLGAFLFFAVPRVVRRLRGRSSSYNRMSDDRPVVA